MGIPAVASPKGVVAGQFTLSLEVGKRRYAAPFSVDSPRLLSEHEDKTRLHAVTRLLDAEGQPVQAFHSEEIRPLELSPEADLMARAYQLRDELETLWETAEHEVQGALDAHSALLHWDSEIQRPKTIDHEGRRCTLPLEVRSVLQVNLQAPPQAERAIVAVLDAGGAVLEKFQADSLSLAIQQACSFTERLHEGLLDTARAAAAAEKQNLPAKAKAEPVQRAPERTFAAGHYRSGSNASGAMLLLIVCAFLASPEQMLNMLGLYEVSTMWGALQSGTVPAEMAASPQMAVLFSSMSPMVNFARYMVLMSAMTMALFKLFQVTRGHI